MKQFAILLISITLFSCKKEVQKQFLISNIAHLNETEVYLSYGAESGSRIDTIKVQGGRFTVAEAPDDAETMQLFFPKNNKTLIFFGDAASRLRVSGDLSSPVSLMVEGDSVNNQLSAYKRSVMDVAKALEQANNQADKAWQKDSLKRYEELLFSAKMMKTRAELRNQTTKFVHKNASTFQALLAARQYIQLTGDIQAITRWWNDLKGDKVKEFSTFLELKKIYKQMLPMTVGRAINSFQTYNTDNKQEYTFAPTGKKTLMLVWSSTDKYSAFLNKKLSDSADKLAKDTIGYTAVSLDDSFQAWQTAVKNLKGKQMIVRFGFQNEDFKKTGIIQTPTLVLFGKDGKVAKIYDSGESPLR